jgi:hypothetical protein
LGSRQRSVRGGENDRPIGIPIVIFVLCLSGGAVAAAKWLPALDAGSVAGLAFFAVCGLLGLALALLGEHVYLIANELKHASTGAEAGLSKAELLGGGLRNIALDEGTVLGIAFAVYLLAPRLGRETLAAREDPLRDT